VEQFLGWIGALVGGSVLGAGGFAGTQRWRRRNGISPMHVQLSAGDARVQQEILTKLSSMESLVHEVTELRRDFARLEGAVTGRFSN
jgi:hypothetical protein